MITRKQLRNARKACGYTQERMASALGYSLSYYKKIEEGFSHVPASLEAVYLVDKIEKYQKSVLSTVTLILGGDFVKP